MESELLWLVVVGWCSGSGVVFIIGKVVVLCDRSVLENGDVCCVGSCVISYVLL